MSTEQRVAIVESDESEAILIGRILTDAGFDVQYADGMKTGLKLIAEWKPQVVISAPYLKQGTGIELCQALQGNAEHSGVYTILHASCGSRALAEAALEAMADDFFETQAVHTDLVPRVRVGFRIWRMHEKLRNAALTDALTGLFNHGHFHTRLESEIARARRYGHPVALIVLDIDFFKAINDTHGHLAGNIVLQEVANILRNCARDADVIGRIGGEEFAIIAPETSAGTAQQLAERIRHAMPIGIRDALPQQASPVTASFGVADSECAGVNNATTLMDIADRALYAAKRGGRNRVKLGNELDPSNELEAHVENNEVEWLRRRLSVLTARVQDVYVQSVATLLKALDEKDPYAARHSVNVASYAESLAGALGCSKAVCTSVYNAGLLHDIGKVGVPDGILMKRTPLTPLEQMVLEQVPLIGTRIVDHMRILESEIQIIRHQREHFDGSGTPSGLKGDQIPIGARIIMVADAFDAMTTDRVYRARMPVEQALAEINRLGGTQFDPHVAAALQKVFFKNRPNWESRIRDAIVAARVPSGEGLSYAAEGFNPALEGQSS